MKIKKFLSSYKNRLFLINSEPLTTASKIFLFIFVIFSIVTIYKSLDQQIKTVERPHKKFSSLCISLVSEKPANINIERFRQISAVIKDVEK